MCWKIRAMAITENKDQGLFHHYHKLTEEILIRFDENMLVYIFSWSCWCQSDYDEILHVPR